MDHYCRGPDCDCEEYTPPEDPTAFCKCQECGHGKSKHPKPDTAIATPAESKKSVLELFAKKTQKPLVDILPASASAAVVFRAARDDALKGFRTDTDSSTDKKRGSNTSGKKDKVRWHSLLYGCYS